MHRIAIDDAEVSGPLGACDSFEHLVREVALHAVGEDGDDDGMGRGFAGMEQRRAEIEAGGRAHGKSHAPQLLRDLHVALIGDAQFS